MKLLEEDVKEAQAQDIVYIIKYRLERWKFYEADRMKSKPKEPVTLPGIIGDRIHKLIKLDPNLDLSDQGLLMLYYQEAQKQA